jgi:hypothetical protein
MLGQAFGHTKRLVDPDDFLQFALGVVAKRSADFLSSAPHRILSCVSRKVFRAVVRFTFSGTNLFRRVATPQPVKVPVWDAAPERRKTGARLSVFTKFSPVRGC